MNYLTFKRYLKHPPAAVEKTFKAVCLLMGKNTSGGWRDILKVVSHSSRFRQDIQQFEPNEMSSEVLKTLDNEFLSDSEWTFEAVNKASKVAGPMFLWVRSHVTYAHLLDQQDPMQREIAKLKKEMTENEKQSKKQNALIEQLKSKNMENKAKYAQGTQRIYELKKEMKSVEQRVDEHEITGFARFEKQQSLIRTYQLEYAEKMRELGVNPDRALIL